LEAQRKKILDQMMAANASRLGQVEAKDYRTEMLKMKWEIKLLDSSDGKIEEALE
jgi:hypothetical protein